MVGQLERNNDPLPSRRIETLDREIEARRSSAALPAARTTLLQLDEEISLIHGFNSKAQHLLDECSAERVCVFCFPLFATTFRGITPVVHF